MGLDTLWPRGPTAACLHSRCHPSPHPRPRLSPHILFLAAAAPPTPESSGQSSALGLTDQGVPLPSVQPLGQDHPTNLMTCVQVGGGHQVACSPRGQGRLRPLTASARSPAGSVQSGHFQGGSELLLPICEPGVAQGKPRL